MGYYEKRGIGWDEFAKLLRKIEDNFMLPKGIPLTDWLEWLPIDDCVSRLSIKDTEERPGCCYPSIEIEESEDRCDIIWRTGSGHVVKIHWIDKLGVRIILGDDRSVNFYPKLGRIIEEWMKEIEKD